MQKSNEKHTSSNENNSTTQTSNLAISMHYVALYMFCKDWMFKLKENILDTLSLISIADDCTIQFTWAILLDFNKY